MTKQKKINRKKKINWMRHPCIDADHFEGVVQVDFRRIKEGHYFNANDNESYELITSRIGNEFETIQRYNGGIRCSKFYMLTGKELPCSFPENLFYRDSEVVFLENDPHKYRNLDEQLRDMDLTGEEDDLNLEK
ncbi:MAG: hypothetical protein PHH54_07340 [Candidatus Nanoarchaeia archaeon]|nr:hypothetical protein [Candidatus Nanoarchaeia archaeon]MDD5741769.1 hypothetical protein [Candidatus Nanoarchaeia archaeon]